MAAVGLLSLYLGVMSLDGGFVTALRWLSREWWLIGGITLAFGLQVGLYHRLRTNMRTLKAQATSTVGALTTTTTASSMLVCCLHHATDVLPLIGLTALGTFFGQYRSWFFGLAYLSSAVGIVIMLRALRHQRLALDAIGINQATLLGVHSHGPVG